MISYLNNASCFIGWVFSNNLSENELNPKPFVFAEVYAKTICRTRFDLEPLEKTWLPNELKL